MSTSYRIAMVALSLLLATLSWRYVETPFRKRQYCPSRKSVFAFGALAATVVLASGALLYRSAGFPQRVPAEALNYARAKMDRAFIHELTTGDVLAGNLIPIGASTRGEPVEWLVWGDSHAMAALPAFDTFLKEQGLSGQAATHSATAPVLGYFDAGPNGLGSGAIAFNDAVFAHLKARRIPNVVLIAAWPDCWADHDLQIPGNHPFDASLIATVQKIVQAGSRPWLLLDVPGQSFDVPRWLALFACNQREIAPLCAKADPSKGLPGVDPDLVSKLRDAGACLIDPRPAFLSEDRTHYIVASHGTALYRDNHHLSTRGAEMILLPLLREAIPAAAPTLLNNR